jgi:hypothetical protein
MYVLIGKITSWIKQLITYIKDPLNYDDLEPHSKTYNAGGTEMPLQELAQTSPKRRKIHHSAQTTPMSDNTHRYNNRTIHPTCIK